MSKGEKCFDLSHLDNVTSSKVYVTKDGNAYEWSFNAPAHVATRDNDIFDGAYSVDNLLNIFAVMPEVFAPVNEIASRVSGLKFVLKRYSDDEIIWDNKDFNRLFSSPNPISDFKNHIWQKVVFEIVTGASFQYMNTTTLKGFKSALSNIKTITNVPTNKAIVELDKTADIYTATAINEIVKRVYVKRANGTDRDFEIERLIMSVNIDPSENNTFSCYRSWLRGATAAIRNLIPVYIARNQIYVKRGALGVLVSKKTDASGSVALTPKEKEDLQREFQRNYGITGQNSLFPIAAAEVDFVKTSADIRELEPFEETAQDARAIYATLRVPKHLCPTKENSTFNNADTDMKTFYLDVILPIGERIAQEYTTAFGLDGFYVDVDTSGVSVLEENKKDRASVNQTEGLIFEKRFKNGVCTLNDWVVATGGEKSNDPMYDKRILEMSPEEIEKVKQTFNFNLIIDEQQNTSPEGGS